MRTFDIRAMESYPYDKREGNVFYQAPQLKARIIELPARGCLPPW
jgi:hypothetical protein